MSKLESFDIEDNNKKGMNEESKDLIDRYKVDNTNNLNIPLIVKNSKKRKFPILFYVFIFALLLLLSLIISLIVKYFQKHKNYTIYENIYLKPNISHHNYTNIKFENGLELLLIKVDESDEAGGSIVFDSGFLDTNYKPGLFELAFISLITDKIEKSTKLNDYLGEFHYSIGEHYSSFNFKILNAGFFAYLQIFANLTFLNEENSNRTRIRYDIIKKIKNKLINEGKNLKKREDHLLQFLVYGYKDGNGNDIFPEGNNIANLTDNDTDAIINIMDSLLNPSKMKIVLNSHFKMSLMKNKFLKYFNKIINVDKDFKKSEQKYAYNISEFTAKKIIFMNIENYQTNYIKINYYITPKEKKFEYITINSGYLYYMKYILDETNPESLYYNLSENYNIKSLSCDFEVILKSKIKFSININLNYYSYVNLDGIILKVYQYMDNLKDYVNSLQDQDKRANELFSIMGQIFSFTEDMHDITPNNEAKGINLFCKNNKNYFLRDAWLPGNFDISKLKEYVSQFTPNNSVLIIGINNDTLKNHSQEINNSTISDMFINPKKVIHYEIEYTIDDLDKILKNDLNNAKYDINKNNYKNDYISIYNGNSKLEFNKKDMYNYLNLNDSTTIKNNSLTIFYYKKDTSFHIPKVYITLNFFHPFMRPHREEEKYNHQRFFEVMLYMSYIKREINLQLADAIRSGNTINMGYNHNLFYIDIFSYSDLAFKILKKIKEIVKNNSIYKDISEKFELYKEAALEDFLNFETVSENMKMRMAFYEKLFNNNSNEVGVYNYYKFPSKEYKNKNISDMEALDMKDGIYLISSFILNGHIYGYLNLSEAKKIYNLFNDTNNNFKDSLVFANISTLNVNEENFTDWMKKKNILKLNKSISYECINTDIKIFRYLHWAKYDLKNKVITDVFNKLLEEAIYYNKDFLSDSLVFSQGEIYFQFKIKEKENDEKNFEGEIETILNKNKKSFTINIDSVGNRLYYIIKNIVENLYSSREDMKSSAISRINSNTHNIADFKNLGDMKKTKYDEFIRAFRGIYKNEFHVDFICNNTNTYY